MLAVIQSSAKSVIIEYPKEAPIQERLKANPSVKLHACTNNINTGVEIATGHQILPPQK